MDMSNLSKTELGEGDMSDYDEYDVLGEVMSIEEFQQCVEAGMFVDDDGIGYACDVNGNEDTNIRILPSQLHMVPEEVDYVAWYNK